MNNKQNKVIDFNKSIEMLTSLGYTSCRTFILIAISALSFFPVFLNAGKPGLPVFSSTTPSVLFLGMENYITIQLNGSDSDQIQLKVFPGNIYRRDDSTFAFSPHYAEGELKLKLYYKSMICDIKIVEVKQLPNFTPVLDKEKNGFIKISDTGQVQAIRLVAENDIPEDMIPRIQSYNMYIIDKNGMYIFSAGMRDEVISVQASEALKKAKPGYKIQINNVATINKFNVTTRLNIHKEVLIVD